MKTIGDCLKTGEWIHYIDTGYEHIHINDSAYQETLQEMFCAKPKDKAYAYKLVYRKNANYKGV